MEDETEEAVDEDEMYAELSGKGKTIYRLKKGVDYKYTVIG